MHDQVVNSGFSIKRPLTNYAHCKAFPLHPWRVGRAASKIGQAPEWQRDACAKNYHSGIAPMAIARENGEDDIGYERPPLAAWRYGQKNDRSLIEAHCQTSPTRPQCKDALCQTTVEVLDAPSQVDRIEIGHRSIQTESLDKCDQVMQTTRRGTRGKCIQTDNLSLPSTQMTTTASQTADPKLFELVPDVEEFSCQVNLQCMSKMDGLDVVDDTTVLYHDFSCQAGAPSTVKNIHDFEVVHDHVELMVDDAAYKSMHDFSCQAGPVTLCLDTLLASSSFQALAMKTVTVENKSVQCTPCFEHVLDDNSKGIAEKLAHLDDITPQDSHVHVHACLPNRQGGYWEWPMTHVDKLERLMQSFLDELRVHESMRADQDKFDVDMDRHVTPDDNLTANLADAPNVHEDPAPILSTLCRQSRASCPELESCDQDWAEVFSFISVCTEYCSVLREKEDADLAELAELVSKFKCAFITSLYSQSRCSNDLQHSMTAGAAELPSDGMVKSEKRKMQKNTPVSEPSALTDYDIQSMQEGVVQTTARSRKSTRARARFGGA